MLSFLSFQGAQRLQNIHPLFVHYPIAFWTGAALFYVLAWISRNKDVLAKIGFVLLILGTLGGIVAASTGLYAEDGVMIARSVREVLLDHHKDLMLIAVSLGILASVWSSLARPFPKKGRAFFVLLLLGLLAVLTAGADYGARMVYGYNAGGDACSQPIEYSK